MSYSKEKCWHTNKSDSTTQILLCSKFCLGIMKVRSIINGAWRLWWMMSTMPSILHLDCWCQAKPKEATQCILFGCDCFVTVYSKSTGFCTLYTTYSLTVWFWNIPLLGALVCLWCGFFSDLTLSELCRVVLRLNCHILQSLHLARLKMWPLLDPPESSHS